MNAKLITCAIASCSLACSGASRAASYGAELELCLDSAKTCDAYVACRKEVSKKYDRPFGGYCVTDAGSDAIADSDVREAGEK